MGDLEPLHSGSAALGILQRLGPVRLFPGRWAPAHLCEGALALLPGGIGDGLAGIGRLGGVGHQGIQGKAMMQLAEEDVLLLPAGKHSGGVLQLHLGGPEADQRLLALVTEGDPGHEVAILALRLCMLTMHLATIMRISREEVARGLGLDSTEVEALMESRLGQVSPTRVVQCLDRAVGQKAPPEVRKAPKALPAPSRHVKFEGSFAQLKGMDLDRLLNE